MNTITVKNAGKSFKVFIRDTADESVAAEIFKHHEYRVADSMIQNAAHPIIDAGAHAGFFIMYVRSLNSTVKIIALEPDKANHEQLQEHLRLNTISNVELVPMALAGTTGQRSFFKADDSHNHSLVTETAIVENVSTISLSDLLKKCILEQVSLLKLDIEGAEYEVLQQTPLSILQKIKAIALEYHAVPGEHFTKLEQFLRTNGYGVRHFPSKFDKTMGFLFAQRKSS